MISSDKCPTNHIQDTPSEIDSFGSGHQKIAEAIAQLIRNTESGHTIGLEGNWGSGKSTIVHLLKNILNQTEDYKFIIIDAWAHEGDPLRRIFLRKTFSTVISWIKKNDDKEKLEEKIEGLAGPKIQERTIKNSWFLVIFFFFFTLLPISVNLVVGQLDNVTFLNVAPKVLNYTFLIGSLLIIVFFILLILLIKNLNAKVNNPDFSFYQLFRPHPNDVITINPSSIDFESCFREIIRATISESNKKIIIVIDNIDRIDPQNAKEVLNTLQTFIDKDNNDELIKKDMCELYKNVWVLIPYDKKSLSKIWNPDNQPELKKLALAFFYKRFQTVFMVPPIIKSNWKHFFLDMLQVEFPNHRDIDQLHLIFESFNANEIKQKRNPNPRDIIRFINQLGTYHMIWQDRLPLEVTAYYICNILNDDDEPIKLLDSYLNNGAISDDTKKNLLALYYNLEPNVAFEVHFGDLLYTYLETNDYKDIANYHNIYSEGFWCVLDEIDINLLGENNKISQLCLLTRLLVDFTDNPQMSRRLKTKLFKSLIIVKDWSWLEPEHINELTPIFEILNNSQIQEIFNGFSKIKWLNSKLTNESPRKELRDTLLTGWYLGINNFIKYIKENNIFDNNKLSLPFDEKGLFEFLTIASRYEESFDNWSCFQIEIKSELITKMIIEQITNNSLEPENKSLNKLSKGIGIEVDWFSIIEAISPKLLTLDGQQNQIDIYLPFLMSLKDQEISAQSLLEQFAISLNIFNLLQLTSSNLEVNSFLIFTLIYYSKGQFTPTSANQPIVQQGNVRLIDIFTNPKNFPEILNYFTSIVINYSNALEFFKTVNVPTTKLFLQEILRVLLSDEVFFKSLSPTLVLSNWKVIKEASNEKYFELLKSNQLISEIINNQFDDDKVEFYIDLVNRIQSKNKKKFLSWFTKHLNSITGDQWVEYFVSNSALITFLAITNEKLSPIHLKMVFIDAIEAIAKKIIFEGQISQVVLENWPKLKLSYSDNHLFIASMKRILKYIIDQPNMPGDDFYNCFGDDINNDEVLVSTNDIVQSLFTEIVTGDNATGVQWLHKVISRYPSLLTKIKGQKSEIYEFKCRIFEKSEDQNSILHRQYQEIINIARLHKPKPKSI